MNEPGRKDDIGKPRYDLVPWGALEAVVKVLTYGAKKYAPENWLKVPDWKARYTAALFRHAVAYARGEKRDPETGESPLASVVCCAFFLMELEPRLSCGQCGRSIGPIEGGLMSRSGVSVCYECEGERARLDPTFVHVEGKVEK